MEAFFGSDLFNVIVFASGVASIISLLIAIWQNRPRFILMAISLLAIALSVLASYSYFQYRAIQSVEYAVAREKEIAASEARSLVNSLPSYLFLEPGKARGVAVAGLAYLERYKHVYPETFALAQQTVRADIESAQKATGTVEESQILEVAGETMLYMLHGLAGEPSR